MNRLSCVAALASLALLFWALCHYAPNWAAAMGAG